MTTVLLTGVEPFGDDARNPSGEAVVTIGAARHGDADLATAVDDAAGTLH